MNIMRTKTHFLNLAIRDRFYSRGRSGRAKGLARKPAKHTNLFWDQAPNIEHDGVIKWKHFPHYWSFVRGIYWSPVNSPQKGQLRGALMFSLICAWINGWANIREAGDLRRHRVHYDVTIILLLLCVSCILASTKRSIQYQWQHRIPGARLANKISIKFLLHLKLSWRV